MRGRFDDSLRLDHLYRGRPFRRTDTSSTRSPVLHCASDSALHGRPRVHVRAQTKCHLSPIPRALSRPRPFVKSPRHSTRFASTRAATHDSWPLGRRDGLPRLRHVLAPESIRPLREWRVSVGNNLVLITTSRRTETSTTFYGKSWSPGGFPGVVRSERTKVFGRTT